MVTALID